jgi:hypothetical protein
MDEMIKKLDAALRHLRLTYVLIGGVAASILGKPRMTIDADIVVIITKRRLPILLNTLKTYGFKIPSNRERNILEKLKSLLPVKIPYKEGFSIDIRVASYSLDKKAIKRALKVELFGKILPIATPEDLILYKSIRFSDLDRADIKAIVNRFKERLDLSYIKEAGLELMQEAGYEQLNENLTLLLPKLKKQED